MCWLCNNPFYTCNCTASDYDHADAVLKELAAAAQAADEEYGLDQLEFDAADLD